MNKPKAFRPESPLTVRKTGTGGTAVISVDFARIPRPDATLPIDCCMVARSYEAYHLRFGCLSPVGEGPKMTRVLAIRLSSTTFVEHYDSSTEFISSLGLFCEREKVPAKPGEAVDVYLAADKSDADVAVVDVDILKVSSSGKKSALVGMSLSNWDLFRVMKEGANDIECRADIEVTMPLNVMRDLYRAWGDLRKEVVS